MRHIIIMIGIFLSTKTLMAQDRIDSLRQERIILDSVFLAEIEEVNSDKKPKILHAEPLYIDLIRDLGARKGEKEWNLGMGMSDRREFNEYELLVEYEWAPVDRIGLEIEVPLTIYSSRGKLPIDLSRPSNRVESLKLAGQWSFLVSEKAKTSLAIGYIHEFQFTDLNKLNVENLFRGNVFNPFFIAAKRWGSNYHTLIYTGPRLEKLYNGHRELAYEVHTNFHYMITGTRNFIGIEINKEFQNGMMHAVLRPQMRIGVTEKLMIGIVTGIPITGSNEGLSSFIRLIYETGFRAVH